ncbi:hypothetical protein CKM354_001020600 [Cercospora kikuchii]|uniref:Thymidylate kinase n=1 Tax=Cercospora kikuchii TaxID=84275 RepID=A0A9P3CR31_9PEZI|nr:uncharacterized protein CKM354_001020600 [Cercospora kikuchii]GIZ47106.1 hypothetical protein CKM354_001020600 [Cercospora kikuchii]
MTAHVPMARVPFAPLDNPRLQHLASAKNRQNGVNLAAAQKSGKTNMNNMKTTGASNKRAYESCNFDDFDSENVDPAMFDSPSKKTKGNAFDLKQQKSFTFSLTTSKPMTTMAPPSTFSASASPRALSTPLRRKMSSPRAPLTAPAGRSPKRKVLGVGGASRRISAPFTRIDPPSFGTSSSASALPFSLDAALSGSLPNSSAKMASSTSGGATIAESMPKNWFFEIYEDTPEEEAANLMEHSTLTLDLSSDDEGEMGKKELYRGKENTPPEGYDAPTASSPRPATAVTTMTEVVRTKVLAKDEMDDGSRSPLSDLETEGFFPEGLSKESFVVVDEETPVVAVVKDVPAVVAEEIVVTEGVVAAQEAAAAEEVVAAKDVVDSPVVDAKGDVKGEIIVWQDEDVV